MTHKHVYLLPFDGEMTDDEVLKQAYNTITIQFLAKNCEGWKGKTQDDLEARVEMIKSAMHDKNVIMLSEHEGTYSIMRSVESEAMIDKLIAKNLPAEEAEKQDEEDEENNEPKVGDHIVIGVPVKVVETDSIYCEGCVFGRANYCHFLPKCYPELRKDSKNVIFVYDEEGEGDEETTCEENS